MADPTKPPPVGEQPFPAWTMQHHAFRTLTQAPRFEWPDNARIAFTVTLVLDYWEVNPPEMPVRDPRIVSPLGKYLSRLADLEPTRIRRARRHLPACWMCSIVLA